MYMTIEQAVEIVAKLLERNEVTPSNETRPLPQSPLVGIGSTEVAIALSVLLGHVAESLAEDPDWGKATAMKPDSPLRLLANLLQKR